MDDKRIRHATLATLGGVVLVGIVALLVTARAPGEPTPPVITVPSDLQAAALAAAASPALAAEPPRSAAEQPPLAAEAPPPSPVSPKPSLESAPADPTGDLAQLEVEEVAPPPALPPMRLEAPTPEAVAPRPPAPPPAPPTAGPAPTSIPVAPAPFRVRFASVDDLAGLVEDTHVILVLEFPDGRRYRLPQRLLTDRYTAPVDEGQFAAWVDEGRVSELVPTPELRERLSVHGAQLRYLAVLDTGLRDRVAALVPDAADAAVSLTIARGPTITRDGA